MAEDKSWVYTDKTTGESESDFNHGGYDIDILGLFYKHRHSLHELISKLPPFDQVFEVHGEFFIGWLMEREGHDIVLTSDCGNELQLMENPTQQLIEQHERIRPVVLLTRLATDNDAPWTEDTGVTWLELSPEGLAERMLSIYKSIDYLEWPLDTLICRAVRVEDLAKYNLG